MPAAISEDLMRTALFTVLLLSVSVCATAQSTIGVEIREGQSSAWVAAVSTPYATGGPWAAVPARALKPDVTPSVTDFRIRTWVEGESVRVLVFAVSRKAGSPLGSDDEREIQIASVALSDAQTAVITATEKYNARAVTVIARRPN